MRGGGGPELAVVEHVFAGGEFGSRGVCVGEDGNNGNDGGWGWDEMRTEGRR